VFVAVDDNSGCLVRISLAARMAEGRSSSSRRTRCPDWSNEIKRLGATEIVVLKAQASYLKRCSGEPRCHVRFDRDDFQDRGYDTRRRSQGVRGQDSMTSCSRQANCSQTRYGSPAAA
jgi:hypothetical protein